MGEAPGQSEARKRWEEICRTARTARTASTSALLSQDVPIAIQALRDAGKGTDAKQTASAQTELLSTFYRVALNQSQASFKVASWAAASGVMLFLAAIVGGLLAGRDAALFGTLGGAIVEVISGLAFYLYGKATEQSNDHLARLGRVQRYLLAIQVAESITDSKLKDEARLKLVSTISGLPKPEE